MKQNEVFLKSTYYRYLPPTMLSILGSTINVIIDGILIGNLVGEEGLLAVNICLPLHLVFYTIGALIASGASILSARALGRNDVGESRRIMGFATLLCLIISVGIVAAGLAVLRPLINLLSGGMPIAGLHNYAFLVICCGIPKIMLYIPFFYLRLEGKNLQMAVALTLMVALNLLLDIIFMYFLRMGIAGAALANLLATLVVCIAGFKLLLHKESDFALPLTIAGPWIAGAIIKNGTPSALNNLTSALRVFVINLVLLSLPPDGGFPVQFAVVTSVSELSLFIINGIPQTAMPIINVYNVEKSNRAIRFLMKRQVISGLLISGLFGLVCVLLHSGIGSLYGVNQSLLIPLACLAVSLLPTQINSIMTCYFNSVDRIALANLITVLRIFVLPVFLLLNLTRTVSPVLWLFLPLSELFTLLIWLAVVIRISMKDPALSRLLLLDDTLENSGHAVEFSVGTDPVQIVEASSRITGFCDAHNMTAGQTMRISLAIEEILTVMAEKSFGSGHGSFDVRAYADDGTIWLRIRNGGQKFNPVSLSAGTDDSDDGLLGIRMISGMVKNLQYLQTFGVNNFFIQIQ
ncbi:MAG: MATE family efflux transporter [Saccharofermentanales bacterium]|jgi:Na+-driven multidrug efflux pump/anti-sigma regulatory factor (Ser/Thr protein kinase)